MVGKSLPIRPRDPGKVIPIAEAQRTHQRKTRQNRSREGGRSEFKVNCEQLARFGPKGTGRSGRYKGNPKTQQAAPYHGRETRAAL